MIRRHKTTIFTDAKESTTVYELKRIVEGILKRPPEDQRLYKVSYTHNDFLSWQSRLGTCTFTVSYELQWPTHLGLSIILNCTVIKLYTIASCL